MDGCRGVIGTDGAYACPGKQELEPHMLYKVNQIPPHYNIVPASEPKHSTEGQAYFPRKFRKMDSSRKSGSVQKKFVESCKAL